MPRYVAFLRAINVGGTGTVRMDALRRIFEGLGFSEVASFIASGNIIFETSAPSTAALEERIERALIGALGWEATPFVRTGAEVTRIAEFKAFPTSSLGPTHLLAVVFLPAPPKAQVKRALKALPSQTEEFRVRGREIYWLRHRTADGQVYSTAPLDKLLAQPFTIRSMNTVKKIADKYFPQE